MRRKLPEISFMVRSLYSFLRNICHIKKKLCSFLSELEPRVASTLLPGLPAYIMFMCIRYADYTNNGEKIQLFLTTILTAIRRQAEKRQKNLDILIVWLVNACCILHLLNQYSGGEVNFDWSFKNVLIFWSSFIHSLIFFSRFKRPSKMISAYGTSIYPDTDKF